jgi:hypothetical protein
MFLLCHLLRKGFLSVFADITDAGGSVAIEQESKDIANKVIMDLAVLHVLVAVGTSMKTFLLTAPADFTPRCFFVLLAPWAFAIEELLACSTIQAAYSYLLGIDYNFFHITYFFLTAPNDMGRSGKLDSALS